VTTRKRTTTIPFEDEDEGFAAADVESLETIQEALADARDGGLNPMPCLGFCPRRPGLHASGYSSFGFCPARIPFKPALKKPRANLAIVRIVEQI